MSDDTMVIFALPQNEKLNTEKEQLATELRIIN